MTFSTELATPPKSFKSRNSNSSVQIQIELNLSLNLYREISRNLSFSIWWILEMLLFQWNLPCTPQVEEIWKKKSLIFTIAKISNKFSLSPRNFQTSIHGIPQDFKQVFAWVNESSLITRENCIIWISNYLKSDLLRVRCKYIL